MHWFEVDKRGLSKLLASRGKEFVLHELISNAWDENATRVDVRLARIPGTRFVSLEVEDDNPNGFADLSHAFVLFAESAKKGDATSRGRFCAGEKLVLSLCEEAEIVSTTGSVRFDERGRHRGRTKRAAGSLFRGKLRLTNEELSQCCESVTQLIPPPHIITTFNDEPLHPRTPVRTFEAVLPTDLGDAEGNMRRTERKTLIEVHEPTEGSPAAIYELGIPVVATGDRYSVNVMQKVPLTLDRTNVTPAYLVRVRALLVEQMADQLTTEDASHEWVRSAVQKRSADLSDSTVNRLMELRFGDKRVSYDPSDTEANHRAVAAGYQLVYGSQLGQVEWEAARRAGAILPAGKVVPTSKPFSPDGKPLRTIPRDSWSAGMKRVAAYAAEIAPRLLGCSVNVTIANDVTWPFAGAYSHGQLTLNLGRLGHRWFDGGLPPINELLIHEFAHHDASNHLSDEYHQALCRLGARLTELALTEPHLFAAYSDAFSPA